MKRQIPSCHVASTERALKQAIDLGWEINKQNQWG